MNIKTNISSRRLGSPRRLFSSTQDRMMRPWTKSKRKIQEISTAIRVIIVGRSCSSTLPRSCILPLIPVCHHAGGYPFPGLVTALARLFSRRWSQNMQIFQHLFPLIALVLLLALPLLTKMRRQIPFTELGVISMRSRHSPNSVVTAPDRKRSLSVEFNEVSALYLWSLPASLQKPENIHHQTRDKPTQILNQYVDGVQVPRLAWP